METWVHHKSDPDWIGVIRASDGDQIFVEDSGNGCRGGGWWPREDWVVIPRAKAWAAGKVPFVIGGKR
jgi:hypothetical protein